MAIIQCPECGQNVTDKEIICNNCGFPLEEFTAVNKTETIVSSTKPAIYDNQKVLSNLSQKSKKNKLIVLVLVCVIAIFFSVLSVLFYLPDRSKSKSELKYSNLDLTTVRQKLVSNTEYVKEHLPGTWSLSDGTILEIYSNGTMVNYIPAPATNLAGSNISSIIESELKTIGYSGSIIPDPNSYTDEQLQSFASYIQNTDKISVPLKTDFFGIMEDKFLLCEFIDENTLNMGAKDLTRIKEGEPHITNNATGLYIHEQDKTFALSVIKIKDESHGYFEWSREAVGVLDGKCEIDADKVIAKIPNNADFVFQRNGVNLIEIGSEDVPGSNLTYKKISDLAYINQVDITTQEPNLPEDESELTNDDAKVPQENINSQDTSGIDDSNSQNSTDSHKTPINELEFTLNDNEKSYSVTGIGTVTEQHVVIPSNYQGKPVTNIGEYAFSDCYALTSIVIPDSVTSIGEYAFSYCQALTNIVIPDSVTSIGKSAFSYCQALTSIVIPGSVTSIGESTFYNCAGLTSVVISDGVTSIGEHAFSYCYALTSIVIPSSMTSINVWAFEYGSLNKIFFEGNDSDWWNISLMGNDSSSPLYSAVIYYYAATKPTTTGNFWHWSDGLPKVW